MPSADLRVVGMKQGTGMGRGRTTGWGIGMLYMGMGTGTKMGMGTGMSVRCDKYFSSTKVRNIHYFYGKQRNVVFEMSNLFGCLQ